MPSNDKSRWMPSNDKSTLVQVMAWCCQATSHYLSQCWPSLMSPYGVTRPQWVNWTNAGSLAIGPLRTNFSAIYIKIQLPWMKINWIFHLQTVSHFVWAQWVVSISHLQPDSYWLRSFITDPSLAFLYGMEYQSRWQGLHNKTRLIILYTWNHSNLFRTVSIP